MGCQPLVIFASVIIGIVAGIFRGIALITITPAFLWVVFGIAVVYLAILLLASPGNISEGSCGSSEC